MGLVMKRVEMSRLKQANSADSHCLGKAAVTTCRELDCLELGARSHPIDVGIGLHG